VPNLIKNYKGNPDGVVEFMQTEPGVIALIDSMTASVAGAVQAEHPQANNDWGTEKVEVTVDSFVGQTTHPKGDRYAGMVTIAHPAGIGLEAKYGYLQRAAAAAGFEWGRRNEGVTSELTSRENANHRRVQTRAANRAAKAS
jgi:hypothetical protein